ncbi:MAG: baseplate J/gp47 family protein [Eubacteriales bacterium]|nr:baseplate J/gp47 family protein [Eubacteriales bacterium]
MASETAANLLKTMLDTIDDSYQKTIGYPTYDILATFALSLEDTYSQLEDARNSLDPDTLSGEELTKYVYQRRGIVRKSATYSSVMISVTGTGAVPSGSIFETDGGMQFAVDEDTEIEGAGDVFATCLTAGSIGNVAALAITRMPVTIPGIVSCVNNAAASGGYDEESDGDLLDRFYLALREPAVSGNVAHYKQWAMEVPGVGMAQVYPLARGANTVEVMILNEANLPADEDLLAAVQQYIDPGSSGTGAGVAPIGAYVYVIAPETMQINISVTVTAEEGADQDVIQASIEENLSVYLAEICMEKDYVSYGKTAAYLAASDGVEDFESLRLNGKMENIAIPTKTVAILGEVNITYVG